MPATQRDTIVDFVTSRGQARAAQIAAHLGVAVSSIGGHLRALVRQGRLVRLDWGLYAPGPKVRPPPVHTRSRGP